MAAFLAPPDFPRLIFNMIYRNSSNYIFPDPSRSTAKLIKKIAYIELTLQLIIDFKITRRL
jgi:hypothetical protein